MFKNCIATNLLVAWKEIPVSVEIQRPYEKVGKVKCTARTMRNPLSFLQFWFYTLLEGSLPKSSPVGFAVMSATARRSLPNAPFRDIPGYLLERFYCCFPTGKGSHGGIKWPLLWQHPQLPDSRQQMLKLLPYFKLLSHYMEKIRQSLLLAVMPSSRASPGSGLVCLLLGRRAVRERYWGCFIWGRQREDWSVFY